MTKIPFSFLVVASIPKGEEVATMASWVCVPTTMEKWKDEPVDAQKEAIDQFCFWHRHNNPGYEFPEGSTMEIHAYVPGYDVRAIHDMLVDLEKFFACMKNTQGAYPGVLEEHRQRLKADLAKVYSCIPTNSDLYAENHPHMSEENDYWANRKGAGELLDQAGMPFASYDTQFASGSSCWTTPLSNRGFLVSKKGKEFTVDDTDRAPRKDLVQDIAHPRMDVLMNPHRPSKMEEI